MPSSFFSFESHLSSTVPDNSILVISAALVILIFVILCVTILRIAYVDYRSWYGLDGGGLPHNVFGWVVQSLLRLYASKDTKSTFCYDDPKYVAQAGEVCTRSFLTASGGLEIRKGETPSIAKWVAPHRQLDQLGAEEMKEVCHAYWSMTICQPLDVLGVRNAEIPKFTAASSRARLHKGL